MITALLLTLVLQSNHQPLPSSPNQAAGVCSVHTFQKGDGMAGLFPDEAHILKASKTRTVYLCDAFYGGGSIMQVTVPKVWFAQHCKAGGADAAQCDAVYMGAGAPAPITKAAAPPRDHPHLKAVGYGVASVAVLALCVVGGCGFMGGGL
jgi:hypothetical protein